MELLCKTGFESPGHNTNQKIRLIFDDADETVLAPGTYTSTILYPSVPDGYRLVAYTIYSSTSPQNLAVGGYYDVQNEQMIMSAHNVASISSQCHLAYMAILVQSSVIEV